MRFKASEAGRFLAGLALAAIVLGFVALRVTRCTPQPAAGPPPAPAPRSARAALDCRTGPAAAALTNAGSLQTLAWAPFGRPETGWRTYVPLISREIGARCPPQTPGFAAALAAWEARRRRPVDGVLSGADFAFIKGEIQQRRPFLRLSAEGICPDPPPPARLAEVAPQEGYGGKRVQLRRDALAAYRRMAAAARAEDPAIAADPRNLTIFSGFRSPAHDAARCADQHNCNGVVRARCSAHRTGLAMDLYVGQAPGYGPDSSADANRLFMSRTPTYRWLVANAGRFGFVNYPFEPWHWEWTGEQEPLARP